MAHDHWHNDYRIFAALALMNANRIGGLELVHFLPLVFRRMVFAVSHYEPLLPDSFNKAHIAVENIFLLIVPYLHDFVPRTI